VAVIEPVTILEPDFDHEVRLMTAAPALRNALSNLMSHLSDLKSKIVDVTESDAYHAARDIEVGIASGNKNVSWPGFDGLMAEVIDQRKRVAYRIRGSNYATIEQGSEKFALAVKIMMTGKDTFEVLPKIMEHALSIGVKPAGLAMKAAEEAMNLADPERFALLHDEQLIYRGSKEECRSVIEKSQQNTIFWAIKHGGWRISQERAGQIRAKNSRLQLMGMT
jgi:hypothetical protein